MCQSWVTKALMMPYIFWLTHHCSDTEIIWFIGFKFSEIAHKAMHFHYSVLYSWLTDKKTIALCYRCKNLNKDSRIGVVKM